MVGTAIKVGLWLAALYAVYTFANSPGITDSLLLFFTIGLVPGTHTVLSPEATFWWIGGVFAAAILLIFGSNIYRGLRRLFKKREPILQPTAPLEPAPVLHVAPPTMTSSERVAPMPSKPVVVITIPGKPGVLAKLFARLRSWAPAFARVAAAALWRRAVRLAHAARAASRRAAQELSIGTRVVLHYSGNAAEQAVNRGAIIVRNVWQVLEPRLRHFDGWLEQQLKRNDIFRGLVATQKDMRRSYAHMRMGIRTLIGFTEKES